MKLSRKHTSGMTLIEILVVLVLIGVVLGIVGGNFIGRGEKAKADAAKIEIGQIGQTLDLFKLEVGRYPTAQEGLQALISAPPGLNNWNGPYWKKTAVSGSRRTVITAVSGRAMKSSTRMAVDRSCRTSLMRSRAASRDRRGKMAIATLTPTTPTGTCISWNP